MPFDAKGNWVAFLSAADQREIADRQEQARLRASLAALGRITDPCVHVGDPAARARAALTGLYRTAETLLPNFGAIRAYEDPNVLHDAQEAERGARLSSLQKALDHRATQLKEHAVGALESAAILAEKHRPKLDPDNMAQLIRTDQAWNNFIRPQLESGKSWPDIMKNLDSDALLAVQRYAPAYETARSDRKTEHQLPATLAGIERMTQQRLIAVTPEGEARDALQQHVDVQRMHDAVMVSAEQFKRLGTPDVPRNEVVAGTQLGVKHLTYEAGAELGDGSD
ncbi:hypothetical protein [Curtobacterium sp. MCBA15_001]|uniref:hypothetical protein n=1 Tax=Curtobacterium sp. MCBA15_001 TaxID=1898731 RepID=UPI0008DC7FCA|nr:hypothetical protein [Curtobacterium sp. MCBA15_001]OIH95103.1 hypothetical protein BIU90_02900 [Curtobacterium sp. MCBA15_001]